MRGLSIIVLGGGPAGTIAAVCTADAGLFGCIAAKFAQMFAGSFFSNCDRLISARRA
jgi:thioredoxin reductase